MYRIRRATHYRQGDKWCIYPMYDFAPWPKRFDRGYHPLVCSLEYEDHRPLYDWYLDELEIYHPQQIEFARLNISNTILSKRWLVQLVESGHVRVG